MNPSQQFFDIAYKMLISMLPEGLCEDDLEKYFRGDRTNPRSLKEVYIAFIRNAQNYQFMPNVIQFDNREKEIGTILRGFDYEYVSALDADQLFIAFKNAFGISSEKSWRLWSSAVVDSAKYIKSFKDIAEFNKYVTISRDLKSVPKSISKRIKGIGYALACNALKELGYLNYIKPDVHLMDICDSLNICERNQMDVFDAMQKIASDNDITPYKLDKVLWLICSGNFYKDQIRVKGRKEELISELRTLFIEKQIPFVFEKRTYDSDSSFQLKIEEQQVRRLEDELNVIGLHNSSCIPFVGDPTTKIKPDIYSSESHIIGEVYTHLGGLKSSQVRKISSDIFKLILFEKDSGVNFDKYYVVCDNAVKNSMIGNAVIKNACLLYDIHIKVYPLDETQQKELKEVIKRQDITD